MRWTRKPPEPAVQPQAAAIELALDGGQFGRHLRALQEATRAAGGLDACIAAIADKQAVFSSRLADAGLAQLDVAAVQDLLDRVFTARRRLHPVFDVLGPQRLCDAVIALCQRERPADERIQAFVDAMPGVAQPDRESLRAAARVRRAAWDFASELLHFRDPERFPLMNRWVWDDACQTGALRELIACDAGPAEAGLGPDCAVFVQARDWMLEQLRGLGIYRDRHLWVDLVLAQAYVGYMRSMTEGHLGADFARGIGPHEQLCKLLGIEARRGGARARAKRTVH